MPCASAIRTNEFVLAAFGLWHVLTYDAVQILNPQIEPLYFLGKLSGGGENGAGIFYERVLPQADLIRVNIIFGGKFVYGLVLSQSLKDHHGIELVIEISAAAARCLVDAGPAACQF